MSLRLSRLACATLAVLGMPAFAQSPAACAALREYTQPGVALKITSAAHHQQRQTQGGFGGPGVMLPPHCHVEGEIDRRTGSDGKSYALRFAVNMPDDWNGRFLFQGGGGLNGTLGEPLGAAASAGRNALERGFAVVSTDSGHQAQGGFDDSFFADQEASLNFYFLGNMRVTLAAKPLVESYYSDAIDKSYFVGCSTGGREGMIMAQRYPYLYDGIVSGAPAIRTGMSNLALRWMNVHWNNGAKAATGSVPPPNEVWSQQEAKLIVDGFVQACDALDGAEDGLVFDVMNCAFDPMTLACEAGQGGNAGSSCLAPQKAEALARSLTAPVDSRGIPAYSRFVLDTGADDRRGLLTGGAVPPEGPSVDGMLEQDVDAELLEWDVTDLAQGDATALKLSTFYARGGKHIYYHGVSDAWFSAMDTVDYYTRMAEANGGAESVAQSSRLFLVPGMGHCAGGEQTLDSFDMLEPIVNWVENGAAPTSVLATGATMPGVSRPLCPFPQHAQYSGSGDVNDAGNYQCR
ncbi:MAG: tannase/feruloyl esterase family alpha/beta hydrolase [Gammaproteobacteria bacterium]